MSTIASCDSIKTFTKLCQFSVLDLPSVISAECNFNKSKGSLAGVSPATICAFNCWLYAYIAFIKPAISEGWYMSYSTIFFVGSSIALSLFLQLNSVKNKKTTMPKILLFK